MTRETVHYQTGQAPVRRAQALAATRTDLSALVSTSEVWEGPTDALRARLRDEARDRRVKPYGENLDRPGLPRGWIAMRVHLTDAEITRQVRPRRRTWPWVAAGLGAIVAGIGTLGYWVWTVLAAAVAGVSLGGLVGAGIVAALLITAAGGTTVVTVVTKVTVKH